MFAVAEDRCAQVYDPPNGANLWRLTDGIEDSFDAMWEQWIDRAEDWAQFFLSVAEIKNFDVPALLQQFELATSAAVAEASALRRSAEGKAVQSPRPFSSDQPGATLLALGFAKGAIGDLCVPYAKLDGA